jgi:hypothetical protein
MPITKFAEGPNEEAADFEARLAEGLRLRAPHETSHEEVVLLLTIEKLKFHLNPMEDGTEVHPKYPQHRRNRP